MNETIKRKFARAEAIEVARELVRRLEGTCLQIMVCGSLRRRKAEVGDVEIVYVPKFETVAGEVWFESKRVNAADEMIEALIVAGVLRRRLNSEGRETWGEKNKLAVHVATWIPVDLFAATESAWFNYIVCRTGSAENNVRICTAARSKGWKWNPYQDGFTDNEGRRVAVKSEREVFELVGLKYLEPWER